jgi:hypothetical protein
MRRVARMTTEQEGWAAYAAEQERHTETSRRLEDMTREARLSREATEKAVRSRFARHEIERALRAADAPEDSMATDDDLLRYEGRTEAVKIVRDMLEMDAEWRPAVHGDPYDKVVFIQGHRHSEPVCAWPDCHTYLTREQMEQIAAAPDV